MAKKIVKEDKDAQKKREAEEAKQEKKTNKSLDELIKFAKSRGGFLGEEFIDKSPTTKLF
jgi:hypothetical protein